VYKFITVQGSCGNPYDIAKCEQHANGMLSQGYELVQVYQTTTAGCTGTQSVLVMIFRHRGA
jgi:hypothetical protein